jgi:hypothetical protein
MKILRESFLSGNALNTPWGKRIGEMTCKYQDLTSRAA